MFDARTGCPERQVEPRERSHQDQVNRIAYMQEDRNDFSAFMNGRMDYFGEAFQSALMEMDAKLEEERDYLAFLKGEMM